MSAAVRRAFASASPGQTVVLAPACSSFDMFRDYAERGRVFKQEVRKLQEEWSTTQGSKWSRASSLREHESNRRQELSSCGKSRKTDARTMSSHQPVDTVKNRPLGTQAAPVCEGGVFARGRLMTADCSRGLQRGRGGTPARLRLLVGSSPRDL